MISIEIYKRILSSLILLPISLFFVIKGSILFILFILTCFFTASYEWQNMSKNKPYNFLGHMFLILSFFSVFYIRNYFGENSLFIFLLLILICISSDLGGYLFGKIIKGPKLTKISPKKTYSGAIGGFILAIFFSIIYFDFSHNITEQNIVLGKKEFIFILIISIVSQVGDIIVSYFKRLSKLDDTGNIIPGHGGILDRIDGMIFVFPFFLIFNFLIKLI
jgi:phosphatidate cytidylyltransferase